MSILTAYEKRLDERDIDARGSTNPRAIDNIKFKPTGEINPFFGLTTIVWVSPETALFRRLSAYQKNIKEELGRAGLGRLFFFLNPASFHMTLCDIAASRTPIPSQEASGYVKEIKKTFSEIAKKEAITGQVQGVGLSSTITALVRFKEDELRKVFTLEKRIKDAAKADIRSFTGHITLAYCLGNLGDEEEKIIEILRSKRSDIFGSLTFSEFDLVCFTDMNSYTSLLSINLEKNKTKAHQETIEC